MTDMVGEAKVKVMISYFQPDLILVQSIAESLEREGISCWYVDGSRVSSDAGQAIIDCQVFLVVLSIDSMQQEHIHDEVALAYITNKAIFPIGRDVFSNINPHIGSDMKLMLAKINWTIIVDEINFRENTNTLINSIHLQIQGQESKMSIGTTAIGDKENTYDATNTHAPNQFPGETGELTIKKEMTIINCDFWERHFTGKTQVSWNSFRDAFMQDYAKRIMRHFGQEKQRFFEHILYKDVFNLYKTIDKSAYLDFTGANEKADPDYFYERLKDYAIGSFAMREVFNMKSRVRLTAIQNLASYHTPGVMTLLFDLVKEDDANIRAIAALALSKTGRKSKKIEEKLIKLLDDEDRVVRESACLSLAHIKCSRATPLIINLWRNDAIKHVREAAEIALSRIGGTEAEKAVKVTRVLSSEMQNLRSNLPSQK